METRFEFRKHSLKMYNVMYIPSTRIEISVIHVKYRAASNLAQKRHNHGVLRSLK